LGYNKGAKNDPNDDPKTTDITREPADGIDQLVWALAAAAQSTRTAEFAEIVDLQRIQRS
jgi:hypothetical protein